MGFWRVNTERRSILHIIDYLYGQMTLHFENKEQHLLIIDLIRKSGANYSRLYLDGNTLILCCPRSDGNKLCHLFYSRGFSFTVAKERGLYLILRRLFYRPGLCLGALLFSFLLILSTQFVFDIRITGNEILTDAEILSELSENGFICGSFLPKTDIEELCNRIVLNSEHISWISVNMLGTVAHVEVKERKYKNLPIEENKLACLVAARDGVIVGFDCGSGTLAVNVGQTVKKGEVLVNGVFESKNGTYFQNAYGRVRARTNRTFEASLPQTEQIIVGYERVEIEKQIIFLGKTIKVFTKGGNLPSSCDTIKEEIVQLSLSSNLFLPIYEKTLYIELPITQSVTYTKEEAEKILTERIRLQMDEIEDLLVLSSETAFTENKDGYTIKQKSVCIENIALAVPIKTN